MNRIQKTTPVKIGNYFIQTPNPKRFFSSGSKLLDLALGGGWARRRMSNVLGDASTGKTLIAIEAATNFIRTIPKAKVRYRETEHAFDEPYAEALGLPLDRVDFGKRPLETVEDMFEDLEQIIEKARTPELYIVDSLDALSDRAEMARDLDKGSYGTKKAKQVGEMFRRMIGPLEASNVTLMIVSQIRDNVGAVHGRKWTVACKRPLGFYSSQRIFLSQIGKITHTINGLDRVTGIKVKASNEKNKVGIAFRDAEFAIEFGYGVNDLESCIAFLRTTKPPIFKLGEFGSVNFKNPKIRKELVKYFKDLPSADYREDLAVLHKVVEQRWMDTEEKGLPKRKKYE